MGCHKSSFKRQVYSDTIFPQETKKSKNKLLYLLLQRIKKKKKEKQPVEGKK